MKSQSIFLCGFMGVGKSTVGQALARQLAWPFLDTDSLVVKKAGCSIPEIFKYQGESAFRQLESQVLKDLPSDSSHVVSLGGGILTDPKNLQTIQSKGFLIFLEAEIETLMSRLARTADQRPLLAGLSDAQRREKIKALMAERQPQYEKANHRMVTDGQTAQEIAKKIAAQLKEISK